MLKTISFFSLIEFHCAFSLSYKELSYYVYCYFIFACVVINSFPVSFQNFYCSLQRDQSRDVTPRLGVSGILECFFISRRRV